jgi:hypothetical protein
MEEARDLLRKHLYLQGGDGLEITDIRVYHACLDAITEALTMPDVVSSKFLCGKEKQHPLKRCEEQCGWCEG